MHLQDSLQNNKKMLIVKPFCTKEDKAAKAYQIYFLKEVVPHFLFPEESDLFRSESVGMQLASIKEAPEKPEEKLMYYEKQAKKSTKLQQKKLP